MNPFTKRASILGLPIGPKALSLSRVIPLVLGVASVAATAIAGIKAKREAEEKIEEFQDPAHLAPGALGTVEKIWSKVSSVADTVSNVTQAVQGASGIFGKLKAGLQALGGGGGGGGGKKLRLLISHHQDVGVPRTVAYNQWTQLEDFPEFMKGVQSVELEDPEDEDAEEGDITNSNWTIKIGITQRQFKAEVTEAVPDERIAWHSTGGPEHSGVVSFHSLDDNLTRVQVEMEYIPADFIEKIGNIFLAARRKALKDLRLFKHYIELQGEETGAWRGEITPDEEEGNAEDAEEPDAEAEEAEAEEEPEAAASGAS